jgi:hypothetical protein
MPPQCGLFYFEVDVISKGKDGWEIVTIYSNSVAIAISLIFILFIVLLE